MAVVGRFCLFREVIGASGLERIPASCAAAWDFAVRPQQDFFHIIG
jgi:hypothetical protein